MGKEGNYVGVKPCRKEDTLRRVRRTVHPRSSQTCSMAMPLCVLGFRTNMETTILQGGFVSFELWAEHTGFGLKSLFYFLHNSY